MKQTIKRISFSIVVALMTLTGVQVYAAPSMILITAPDNIAMGYMSLQWMNNGNYSKASIPVSSFMSYDNHIVRPITVPNTFSDSNGKVFQTTGFSITFGKSVWNNYYPHTIEYTFPLNSSKFKSYRFAYTNNGTSGTITPS